MSILKLAPAVKDYIWGGDRLIKDFHKEAQSDRVAETWELSCHPDGPSRIVNGENAGLSLQEYIDKEGIGVLGRNCRRFQEFPILVKFIDAKDNLSIQVHPDNTYALKNEGQYGKTEMWYVMDAEEGAFLYYGFSREIDREEFKERIENDTLLEVLNKVPVAKGDVLFIEAGTIHAIGKGIVIAEIQQNSNVTYRVYDYGRVDDNNQHRDLHIEKALAVTNRVPLVKSHTVSPHIARCDYFTVDKMNLDGRIMKKIDGVCTDDSFISLLVLDGEGSITSGDEKVDFQKGDSLFVTASSGEFSVEGKCEILVTTIGEKSSPVRIAVYMTSRSIQTALVDVNNQILDSRQMDISKTENWEQTIERIGKSILDMIQAQELQIDNCIGIGAALPGTIDDKNGVVLYSNNIDWKNVPFVKELQKYLPLPVYINNDACCIAQAERLLGEARGFENVVTMTVGFGIGGCVMVNGKVLEGRYPGASELGHTVIQMDGAACTCGRKGCLEAYASIPAFLKMAKSALLYQEDSLLWKLCGHDLNALTWQMIFDAADQGDPLAQSLVKTYIRYLSAGITNIINIFRPDLFLLYSDLFAQRPELLADIHEQAVESCFGGDGVGVPDVRAAALNKTAGIIGAAALI